MSTLEHTYGPWKVWTLPQYFGVFGDNDFDPTELVVVASDGEADPWTIARVVDGQPGENGPDAQLIAAAPELYEALKLLLNDLRPGGEVQYEHIRQGLRAIEKAEGKSESTIHQETV